MGSKAGGGRPGKGGRLPIEVDEEVDLHGFSVEEAMVQVELALDRNRPRPGAVLRLIHGHSSGDSGSIRGALRRNLGSVWSRKLRSFRPEPGNPGATLVLLS